MERFYTEISNGLYNTDSFDTIIDPILEDWTDQHRIKRSYFNTEYEEDQVLQHTIKQEYFCLKNKCPLIRLSKSGGKKL